MIDKVIAKVFGTKNDREIKRLMPRVLVINALEPEMQKLSDEQLRSKTEEFRERIQERLSRFPDEPGADPDRLKQIDDDRRKATNEVLDEILDEAFAVVREAGRRVLNMRHFAHEDGLGRKVAHRVEAAAMVGRSPIAARRARHWPG